MVNETTNITITGTAASSSSKRNARRRKQRRQSGQESKTVVNVRPAQSNNSSKPRKPKKAQKPRQASMGEFQISVQRLQDAKNACEERIRSFLLGKTSMRKGFVYNRDDQRPVFQRLFPFLRTFRGDEFDLNTRLAFNLHPNPYRTLETVVPPVGTNRAKDLTESISIEDHSVNPTNWCFDHDITLLNGSLVASNHVVAGLEPLKHYSTNEDEFKEGNKIYMSGPSTFNKIPSVSFNNPASYQVDYKVRFIAIMQGADGLEVGNYSSDTISLAGFTSTTFTLSGGWAGFASDMALSNAKGFAIVFNLSANDGEVITTTGSTFSIHLSQNSTDPADFPVFGSAHTWRLQSIFELIGSPSAALKVELDLSDTLAVTGYSLLLTNYTAPINKAGRVFGTEVPADHTKVLPTEPGARMEAIFDFPASVYKMKEPITLDLGVHFANVATRDNAALIPSTFYKDPNKAQFHRPYATVTVDGEGAFNPGVTPNLQLCGWLNVEWRGTSMTFTPIQPPANVGLFCDILDSVLAQLPSGSLWGENPKHESKIASIAKQVVNSKRFKTVLRDVATIGIESLAAVFV